MKIQWVGEHGYAGEYLDDLLANGYFRMNQHMFTTYVAGTEDSAFWVFWLRIIIPQIKGIENHKVANKCQHFAVECAPLTEITQEMQELAQLYVKTRPFETEFQLSYFADENGLSEFDTQVVTVRHEGKLIAMGFFDLGKYAIMGLKNIIHPDYGKYSLGKFLMIEKIRFCKTQAIIYYYPGYISTDTTRFDYKVFPSEKHVEIYNDVEWLPYSKNTLIALNNGRNEEYPDGLVFNDEPEEE